MTTKELAQQVIEQLRGTPFVLALIVINCIALAGFGLTLHEIANALERRDVMIGKCIETPRGRT
jgi:hypothetical protein